MPFVVVVVGRKREFYIYILNEKNRRTILGI
jgi:hypothetical protein